VKSQLEQQTVEATGHRSIYSVNKHDTVGNLVSLFKT